MRTNRILNIICPPILFLLVGFLFGCVREDIESDMNETSSLFLQVQPYNQRSEEGGVAAYDENTIERLTLVFYKNGTKVWQAEPVETSPSSNSYYVPVPESMYGQFNGNNSFKIYLVANVNFSGSFEPNASETSFLKTLVPNSILLQNDGKPEDKFAMIGSVEKQINMATSEGKQLGSIGLKRVAAKLRLKKPVLKISDYELVGDPKAKFRNCMPKGFLSVEEKPEGVGYEAIDYRPMTEANSSVHFYSYYNEWALNNEGRPEFVMMLKLKKTGTDDNTAKPYYYRIPVDGSYKKIRSNHLYDMAVTIEVLGSLNEEDPVTINGSFSVIEWTSHSDDQTLPDVQYLEVIPQETVMNMTTEIELDYFSSHSLLPPADVKATYTYVNSNGQQITDTYTGANVPTVTIDANTKKIKVRSILPINNIPKDISFTIKNSIGFEKKIKIRQNPSQFIINTFGTKSSWNPSGVLPGHLNNKAIYQIVVLSPPADGNMIIGFPPTKKVGFYKKPLFGDYELEASDYITEQDEQTANMVSPSFELASQFGATLTQPYWEYYTLKPLRLKYYSNQENKYALMTCAFYWEERKKADGTIERLDDWRLPTRAEIQLVDKLQREQAGVVRDIMTGRYYWSGLPDKAIKILLPTASGNATEQRAHVRCVRDVKNDRFVKSAKRLKK